MKTESSLQHAATHLSTFSACRRAALLRRELDCGHLPPPPYFDDPGLRLLQERGRLHEARYLTHLEAQHGSPAFRAQQGVLATGEDWARGTETTLAAMRRGERVIYQAPLSHGRWRGCADFLERIDHEPGPAPSALGPYHYRAVDTKLSQDPRGSAVLQLCLYTEILGRLQGLAPEEMVLVSPADSASLGVAEPRAHVFRTADYAAYFRRIRRRMEDFLAQATLDQVYPEVCEHCDICDWWPMCNEQRRKDDHLSFVAGMTRRAQKLLEGAGVSTLGQLGKLQLPMVDRPRKLREETLQRIQHQARLQLDARTSKPTYELLTPVLLGKGLSRLPEPCNGDIFLDLEADRYAIDGTFVYLVGWTELDDNGALRYHGLWASDRNEERLNFERFVDHVLRRQSEFGDLHIYHFAHTEQTILSDLAGRHATREGVVDDFLRQGVFCDLLPVVKQGLRAGVENYSLKDLEQFHGYTRQIDLRQASRARRLFELAREDGAASQVGDAMKTIEAYNREDCESTLHLRDWLEELRASLLAKGESIARPVDAKMANEHDGPSKKVSEWEQRLERLRARLTSPLPKEVNARTEGHNARQLMADLLDWHRRKEKPTWREYFRSRNLSAEECFDESGPIGHLSAGRQIEAPKKNRNGRQTALFEYAFPAQEFKLRADEEVECPVTGAFAGQIVEIHRDAGTVVLKRDLAETTVPMALVKKPQYHGAEAMQEALAEIGESLAATEFGLDVPDDDWGAAELTFPAARALLLRQPPHLTAQHPLRLPGEHSSAAAVRVAPHLSQTVLAVQGPPGAGKSHTAARMVIELLRRGKRVGITAMSHKVIGSLLLKVHQAASEVGVKIHSLQKVSNQDEGLQIEGNLVTTRSGDAFAKQLAAERKQRPQPEVLVAGTQYLWASKAMRASVDVLLIDEAGQFSLANALAVSVATHSLVLLGDPRQLAQPDQGSHPPGAELSALEHVLAGHETIPDDRGIFLDQTWRLPPSIARFTSQHFYANRLAAHPDCARQGLSANGRAARFARSGLYFESVPHEGNVSSSGEEAAHVASLVSDLLDGSTTWTDRGGLAHNLQPTDILIVAPYNAQVQLINQQLEEAGHAAMRVGTVDKFQGQEAPVVIYSMTTSSPADAPRGFEFLFELERLNVATSRAQAVVVVVASPMLLEAECKTPKQMRLVNGLCGAAEFAERLA